MVIGVTFGKKLRIMREEASLTQEELADKLGLSRQMIQKYEAEESKPHRSRVEDFANALEVGIGPAKALFDLPKSFRAVREHPGPLAIGDAEVHRRLFQAQDENGKLRDQVRTLTEQLNSFERLHYRRFLFDWDSPQIVEFLVLEIERILESELGFDVPDIRWYDALHRGLYVEAATVDVPENIQGLVTEHDPGDPTCYSTSETERQIETARLKKFCEQLDPKLDLDQAYANGWVNSALEPIIRSARKDEASLQFLRHLCDAKTEVTPRTGPTIAGAMRANRKPPRGQVAETAAKLRKKKRLPEGSR